MKAAFDSFIETSASNIPKYSISPYHKNNENENIRLLLTKYKNIEAIITRRINNLEYDFTTNINNIYNLHQLILKVTDSCNFRCSYCYYSNSRMPTGLDNQRDMAEETAIKAIDYYFNLMNSNKRTVRYGEKSISFYGGEPLKNFKLIKKCVVYALSKPHNDHINFSMTTNGSLLNDHILEFLIEHKFKLLISLDGPNEEHNKCRLDNGGNGTFNAVMKNIMRIRKNNRIYYDNYISFNAVFCEYHDLHKISIFFDKKPFRRRYQISRAESLGSYFNTKMENYKDSSAMAQQLKTLKKAYIESVLKRKSFSYYANSLFGYQFEKLKKRQVGGFINRLSAYEKGSFIRCSPGVSRLFVSTNGNFHVCERTNEAFPIGDCDNGIDSTLVNRLLKQYHKDILIHCVSCVAVNYCEACFARFRYDDRFHRDDYCKEIVYNLKETLMEYVSILEQERNAFLEYEEWIKSTSF